MLQSNALTTVPHVLRKLDLDESKTEYVVEAINTASSIIETFCDRQFAKAEFIDLIVDGGIEHVCDQYPLLGDLEVQGSSGEWTPIVNPFFKESGVVYEKFAPRSRLKYKAGYVTPTMASELEKRTLPESIELACVEIIRYIYSDDEDMSEREAAASVISTPLKSFELGDMKATMATGGNLTDVIPADIQKLLLPFRKPPFG